MASISGDAAGAREPSTTAMTVHDLEEPESTDATETSANQKVAAYEICRAYQATATALGALNKSTGWVLVKRPKSVCLDKYNREYIVQQEQPHGVMEVPVTAGRRICWKFRPFTLGCYVFRGEDGPRAMGLGSPGGRGASRGTQCARRRPHGGLPRRTLFRTAHRCGVLINLGSCVTEPRRSGSQSDRGRL